MIIYHTLLQLFVNMQFQTMAHNFQASTITNLTNIEQSLGVLKVNYHISFTGHLFEKSRSFEKIVPSIKRY